MISDLEQLEETIQSQDQTIRHLSTRLDKLVSEREKIRGLIIEYDKGKTTATMLVSYLRMYVR